MSVNFGRLFSSFVTFCQSFVHIILTFVKICGKITGNMKHLFYLWRSNND